MVTSGFIYLTDMCYNNGMVLEICLDSDTTQTKNIFITKKISILLKMLKEKIIKTQTILHGIHIIYATLSNC